MVICVLCTHIQTHFHIKWVPCHHSMALLRLWMEETSTRYGEQL